MTSEAEQQLGESRKAWAIFAPIGLLGVWLYFQASPGRLERFLWLLVPDELFKLWTGAEWAETGMGGRLSAFMLAIAWLLASWGAGRLMLLRVSRAVWLPGEQRVFEWIIGLATTSLLTFSLGLAGLLASGLFWLITAGLILSLVVLQAIDRRDPSRDGGTRARLSGTKSNWRLPLLVMLAPLLFLYLLSAWMPPFEFDVMAYHLQVPKEWSQSGRIAFVPHNIYGNMPLGAEMHPLATMVLAWGDQDWWLGAIAGKVVMMSFVLLTAAGLWLAGRRWLTESAGLFAVVIYLTTPWVFRNGTIGHNEMVMGAYAFFAWYAVVIWSEGMSAATSAATPGEDVASQRRELPEFDGDEANRASADRSVGLAWLLMAGWLCGAAAGCKYTAVVFVAAPLWLAVAFWGGRPRWRSALMMLLAGLAAGGGWYLKNALETGNPVYPLAYDLFGGAGWDAAKSERWRRAHYANGHSFQQLRESLARLGWQNVGQSALLPSLMLLALTPWGWPSSAKSPGSHRLRRWLVVLLLFTFATWWIVTHRLDRFLLPALPLAALLAGGAMSTLAGPEKWMRVGVWTLFVLLISTSLLYACVHGDPHYFVSFASLQSAPHRVHPVQLLANTTELIPANKKLLVVADAQVFDLKPPFLYSSCFDDCPLEALVRDKDAEERRQMLNAAGVSHVFVHWRELQRYREPGNYGYPEYITRDLFDELVAQQVLEPYAPPTASDDEKEAYRGLFRVLPETPTATEDQLPK